jgi:hypothetical protein
MLPVSGRQSLQITSYLFFAHVITPFLLIFHRILLILFPVHNEVSIASLLRILFLNFEIIVFTKYSGVAPGGVSKIRRKIVFQQVEEKTWVRPGRLRANIHDVGRRYRADTNRAGTIRPKPIAPLRLAFRRPHDDRRFRPGVVSNVDPVLVPLHKSLFVDHRSFWKESHRTVGCAQVLSNMKLANDKLVNFHASYPRAPDHQATNGNCANR